MCDSKAQLYYACNLHLACNKRQQHGHTKICFIVSIQVYMSTIPYPYKMSRLLDNSWIHQLADCQLADWTSRGLDNSRIPPVTLRAEFSFFWRNLRDRKLSSPRLVQSASCLVCELASPRDVQSASWQSASWHIRELSNYLILQHPT